MMRHLAALLVGKPLNILAVAVLLVVVHVALRQWLSGAGRSSRALLVAAGAWALYAAWEWLVHVRTPDANIRADLLVIWPALAILSVWALMRAVRSLWRHRPEAGRRGPLPPLDGVLRDC